MTTTSAISTVLAHHLLPRFVLTCHKEEQWCRSRAIHALEFCFTQVKMAL
jgi:hypothetical protein